jgi:putative ABC transport system permease protein
MPHTTATPARDRYRPVMLTVALAGLRAHRLRLVATGLAIVLGVGFVAGTLVFGDTARAALFDQFARAARNVDVSVEPPASAGKPAGGSQPRLDPATVQAVRAVPGAAVAEGRMRAYLPMLDRSGRVVGGGDQPGLTMSVGADPRLRPYDVAAGRVPATAGEAALDADTAARTRYRVGDTITVLDTAQRRHQLTLVGLVGFGTDKQDAGQAMVVLTPAAVTALTGVTGYWQVVMAAAPGVRADALAARVRAALPPGDRVRTGAQYRHDLANNAINQVDPFLTVLLVFAVVACVVAAFVSYNTFTILVAHRLREIALLRCVGASRRQVFGWVMVESVLVGLVAAGVGVVLGLALGYALFSGAAALGLGLPAHALVLTAAPVVVAVPLGVFVTVTAALVPAVRATRVPPLRALRSVPAQRVGGRRGRLAVAGLAVLTAAGGTGLTVAGSNTSDSRTGTLVVIAGGMVNFLALLLLSPLFAGRLCAALGYLPGRLLGVPARLAAANARRNPGRVAATTAALMIGVGLMASASVAVATVRQTASRQIDEHYPADFVLRPQTAAGSGIPERVATALRGLPQIGAVAEMRMSSGTVGGTHSSLGAVDPAGLSSLARPELASGSLGAFRDGTVILYAGSPAAAGRRVGQPVRIAVAGGPAGTFTVVALARGRSEVGNALVTWGDLARLRGPAAAAGDDMVLVRAAPGVTPAASRTTVESVTNGYPLVGVSSVAEWRAQVTSSVNQIIAVVAALLAIAIVIALIGIVNTLSLSVVERTQESAVMRALGLTRSQLRLTLLGEALLMGAVGALVGVGFGVLYGWAASRVMFTGFAAVTTIPVAQLVLYVATATAAAALAAVLPARQAARASIVAAMAQT